MKRLFSVLKGVFHQPDRGVMFTGRIYRMSIALLLMTIVLSAMNGVCQATEYRWKSYVSNPNKWNESANWEFSTDGGVTWNPATGYPVSSMDTVIIPVGRPAYPIISSSPAITIGGMTVELGAILEINGSAAELSVQSATINGMLTMDAGKFNIYNGGLTIGTTGNITLNGGTIGTNSALVNNNPTNGIDMSGGTIMVYDLSPAKLENNGFINWTGGTIKSGGTGSFTMNNVGTIAVGGVVYLDRCNFTNTGTLNVNAGNTLTFSNVGSFGNQGIIKGGGTIDVLSMTSGIVNGTNGNINPGLGQSNAVNLTIKGRLVQSGGTLRFNSYTSDYDSLTVGNADLSSGNIEIGDPADNTTPIPTGTVTLITSSSGITYSAPVLKIRSGYTAVIASTSGSSSFQVTISSSPTRIIALTGDLTFGDVQVGMKKTAMLTISNIGNSDLTVNSILYPTSGVFTGDWSGGTIAPGASQDVTVTFAPTVIQSYSGTLTVDSDKTSGTDTMSISGSGVAVSPLTLTWTGAADRNWHNYQNWDMGTVPRSVDSVIIPGSLTSGNWPVIENNKTVTVANLTIAQRTDSVGTVVPERSLTIGNDTGTGYATLTISDSLSNNGTVVVKPSSILNVSGSFINGNAASATRPAAIDIQASAQLNVTGTDLQNKQYGLIRGRGNIRVTPTTAYPSASFINDGRVEPGALYLEAPLPTLPPYFFSGTLTVNGTFIQQTGTLLIDVRPSDSSLWDVATANLYNYLTVNGTADVGGNLIFRYRDYVPAGSYDVVQTSSGNLNPSSWVAIQNVPVASQELLPAAGTAKNTLHINVPCSTYRWSGTSSDEWTNSANWAGTPASYPNSSSVSVFIPDTTNKPQISSVVDICGITMENGSSLNVKSGGGTLTIHNGGYYMNSGITIDGTLNLLGGNHYFKPDFSFSGSGKLTFGQTGTSDYPTIYAKGNLNINVPLSWIGGVVEPEGTDNFTMTLAKNSEIVGSDAFKKLYGMDISIPGGGAMSLKDGTFYLGNKAKFKIDGGILSVDGVMSVYNYDSDSLLTGTIVNNGTIVGNGTLNFATSDPDYPIPVVFTNNGMISPGSYNSSTGTSDIGTLTIQHPNSIQVGTLAIQINSAATGGYDVLSILGTATLGGTLNVTADSTYVPNSTDYFDVLKYSLTRSGMFASVSSSWNAEYADSEKLVRLRTQAATYYTLTVSVNPSGSGKVSIYPFSAARSDMVCPPDCSIPVAAGTKVSLYAMPNSGNSFLYWGGAASGSSVSTEITINSNKSVSAYFSVYVSPDYPYIPPDACPDDPNKTEPGICGCGVADTDSDGDGTPDCKDLCPNNAIKTAPGTCGCDKPDTDSDGDGTPDCNDSCPNNAAKSAPGACGCDKPDTDSDGDGTPDCTDACSADPAKTEPGKCGCGKPETENCGDLCPDDPAKTAPGKCGCGIPETENCGDLCPDDPAKTAPGKCGCGVPETENCGDLCPDDPAKTAPGKCGCGISDTDANGDGITDCLGVAPPAAPTPIIPKPLAVVSQLPVILQANPFASEGTQSHLETHWLIQRTDRLYFSGKNELFDDKTITSAGSSDLTSYAFADAAAGLKYTWKSGYKGSGSNQIAWSEISSFIVGVLQTIVPIEIKAGTEISDYQMISFPYWTRSEKLEDMLKPLIGGYDRRMFRIGTYDPVRGRYVEYGEGLELRPGKAYWILSRNGIRITFDGVPVSLDHAIEMKLDQGWNMIAPPNNADYDLAKLELLVYDDNGKIIYSGLISDTASQEYVDSNVWLWVGSKGNYAPTATLSKNEGSWIRVKKSNVVIRFPASARLTSTIVRNAQEQILRFAQSLFTPKQAIATSDETPPMPMGNTGFTVDSDGVDAGGGCFIDSVLK